MTRFCAVLDSWGKLESGYLQGNMMAWLGRFDECVKIKEEYFNAQYCSVELLKAVRFYYTFISHFN